MSKFRLKNKNMSYENIFYINGNTLLYFYDPNQRTKDMCNFKDYLENNTIRTIHIFVCGIKEKDNYAYTRSKYYSLISIVDAYCKNIKIIFHAWDKANIKWLNRTFNYTKKKFTIQGGKFHDFYEDIIYEVKKPVYDDKKEEYKYTIKYVYKYSFNGDYKCHTIKIKC